MLLKAAHIAGIKSFTKSYYQQKIQELKYLIIPGPQQKSSLTTGFCLFCTL